MPEQLDYAKLKFKCGLEIHQQLDTNKLFCKCPSILRNDEPDFEVHRKLHAVAGESGEVDVAAQYQTALKKEFVYQGYKDNTCLIELDEEPPHEINQEALNVVLQIALLLNCTIQPIIQIMRKTVIDGSNTSGFQRTLLIARSGYVETALGKVGIDTICLEEDSARRVELSTASPMAPQKENAARKISSDDKTTVYRLDRLGIPLIEIATAPDIKSPEQAKEVALHIGNILRSCRVKRGIGTIRQDVNVSIRGENRVELKGMQDMKTFLKTIENEVLRQKKLSDSKTPVKLEVRNALNDLECKTEFLRPMPGADRMYPETDLPLLHISREMINQAKKNLPKLKQEIEEELKSHGLNPEMVKLLLNEHKVDEFKVLLGVYPNPNFVAKMILLFPKEIASKTGKSLDKIEQTFLDIYSNILESISKKKISESDVKEVLIKIANGENFDSAVRVEKKDLGEIEEKILKIIKEKPGLNANAYMGLVMAQMKGQIDGKTAMEIINKLVRK